MFTGLIEEIGTLRKVVREGQAMVLTIEASKVLEDVQVGDSIAVNGVCLTVIRFDAKSVSMDVMPETFRLTNLHELQPGQKVNLERAMSAQGRFGGHMVQGHIDCTGTVASRKSEENAVVFTIRPDDLEALRFILPRGSIALDGISLTVIHVDDEAFAVSIIPHTLAQTILQDKQPGDSVNIETDLLGKYIYKFMNAMSDSEGAAKPASKQSRITAVFLQEHGF